MDSRDFIDLDEGYRPGEPIGPFFAHAEPCESCGRPVFGERLPAAWDESLLIGECCAIHSDELPDEPICEALGIAVSRCSTVAAVRLAFAIHLAECPACRSRRPAAAAAVPVQNESGEWVWTPGKKAA